MLAAEGREDPEPRPAAMTVCRSCGLPEFAHSTGGHVFTPWGSGRSGGRSPIDRRHGAHDEEVVPLGLLRQFAEPCPKCGGRGGGMVQHSGGMWGPEDCEHCRGIGWVAAGGAAAVPVDRPQPGESYWTVERDDLEQPPRLVWYHPEHIDAAVIDVDDLLMSVEERTEDADLASLSEQAITDLCDVVSRASHDRAEAAALRAALAGDRPQITDEMVDAVRQALAQEMPSSAEAYAIWERYGDSMARSAARAALGDPRPDPGPSERPPTAGGDSSLDDPQDPTYEPPPVWDYWADHDNAEILHVGMFAADGDLLLHAATVSPLPAWGQNEPFAKIIKEALAAQDWNDPDGLRAWIVAHGGPLFRWPIQSPPAGVPEETPGAEPPAAAREPIVPPPSGLQVPDLMKALEDSLVEAREALKRKQDQDSAEPPAAEEGR